MRIGINCFEDIEIRSIIKSQGIKGRCEITNEPDTYLYDTNLSSDLSANLSEILDVYTPESELTQKYTPESKEWIENILERDWSIFRVPAPEIKKIILTMCCEFYPKDSLIFNEKVVNEKRCDSGYLSRNCIMKEFAWEKFMESIKSKNRFHSNHVNLELLEKLFQIPGMQVTLKKVVTNLYRARIGSNVCFKKEEMGPPPLDRVTAGRANSAGIRCLYLASDIETTLHESRARDLDYITIATFTAKRNLTVVDLSNLNKISPFSNQAFEKDWFAINMPILKQISNEIAKPLTRQDSELDYLPSQYISDFVKSIGFDGICYRSTLNPRGVNYAMFDYEEFECKDVKLYQIKSLQYNTKEIS